MRQRLMRRPTASRPFPLALLAALLPLSPAPLAAQTSADRVAAGEWPTYHGSLAGTRYAPHAQIDASNVGQLDIAWRWSSAGVSGSSGARNESTPLMVGGMLYFTTGRERGVVAVNAGTGETRWTWSMDEGPRARVAPRTGPGRGVSWWSDGTQSRIFVVTPGFRLVALDAATGTPVPDFGVGGIVDLKLQLGVPLDTLTAAIGASSPPLVFDDVVVVGPALEIGLRPRSMRNVPGRILALDARTGALRWRFNTIPVPGAVGYDTWQEGSAEYTGNAGAWAPLALDEARGYLFLPVEAATGDYYGGHRPGSNLFSTSLVCLDIRTGRRIWHYQIVHHDIWDRDNPTTPMLVDVTVAGRRVEAVVQLTKQAFAYVFDRVTGVPIWPIVEQPVPSSDVPGEQASPTQPIPTKPLPFDRQGVTIDDLIDFTPALRAEAIEAVKPFRLGALFSPASLAGAPDGTRGTLSLPGTLGGSNWEHGAFDPESGTLFVGSYTNPAVLALAKDTARSDMDYVMVGGRVPNVRGLPIVKPPYSRITAIDLNSGDHAWQVTAGDTPENIRSNPALAGLDIAPTGSFARPFVLATRTLLFSAEGWGGAPVLRALDKRTGATIWRMDLPGAVASQPMTYLHEGRQYIAFWVGDARAELEATLLILALRDEAPR